MKSLDRNKYVKLLECFIKNKNLIKHSIAVEACMRALANYFRENEEKWALCGLLHDIDYEFVKGDMHTHSVKSADILKEQGFDDEICHAVYTHNDTHKVEPESFMAKALYCVDPLTGLIVAATLVLPSKKINDLTVENVLNRFKEKSFAKGARREVIKKCEGYLNLSLEEFISRCLKAMQSLHEEIGL